MTTRDKLGVIILAGLFVGLIVVLIYTVRRPEGDSFHPKDSPIVQQRLRNLRTTTE